MCFGSKVVVLRLLRGLLNFRTKIQNLVCVYNRKIFSGSRDGPPCPSRSCFQGVKDIKNFKDGDTRGGASLQWEKTLTNAETERFARPVVVLRTNI